MRVSSKPSPSRKTRRLHRYLASLTGSVARGMATRHTHRLGRSLDRSSLGRNRRGHLRRCLRCAGGV